MPSTCCFRAWNSLSRPSTRLLASSTMVAAFSSCSNNGATEFLISQSSASNRSANFMGLSKVSFNWAISTLTAPISSPLAFPLICNSINPCCTSWTRCSASSKRSFTLLSSLWCFSTCLADFCPSSDSRVIPFVTSVISSSSRSSVARWPLSRCSESAARRRSSSPTGSRPRWRSCCSESFCCARKSFISSFTLWTATSSSLLISLGVSTSWLCR
mmetsp:Transcript_61017/g.178483  ORF Transcript_61017/g.178483 Transcript_61017/m.178483 type:complete len:215 (-) Transcript_61017:260-904(-)